jgi:hypothetical protein
MQVVLIPWKRGWFASIGISVFCRVSRDHALALAAKGGRWGGEGLLGVMGEDCLHNSRAVMVQHLRSGFLWCRGAIRELVEIETARVPSLASINNGEVRATVCCKLQAIKSSKWYPTLAWQTHLMK